jgi:putative Mg2+ transporter-C (MgtC) family protein
VTAALAGDQGWTQIGELGLAFALTSLIGLEREWRHKPTGLRTHTLVGVGAALFVIVSKYGFSDVPGPNVVLDPSRVAAQIVTGIGFIGGGLIFVRGDAVRGLTTAAIVWMSAAIGMACGSGLARTARRAAALTPSAVAVTLELQGQPTAGPLAVALSDLDGVFEATTTDHARNGE